MSDEKIVSIGRTPEARARQQHARRDANPEEYNKRYAKHARAHRAAKMGIFVNDIDAWYDKQLRLQGGRCAMPDCRRPAEESTHGRLDMDHDPQTGQYRALLCRPCNNILGSYENRKMIFAEYVRKHRRGK